MPRDIEVSQRIHLRQRFLHVALAEVPLTGAIRCPDRVDGLRFADRNDRDVVRRAMRTF